MADSGETRLWIKFFTEAGIPSTSAADYALMFAENRIQKNMLLDLNKEYLKDMGILLMGDVIAILRHARTVHDQTAREKVLSSKGSRSTVVTIPQIPDEDEEEEEEDLHHVKKSAVSRIVGHYTRNSSSPTTKSSKLSDKIASRTVSNKGKKVRVIETLKRKTGTLRSDELNDGELSPLRNTPSSVVRTTTPTVTSSDAVPLKKVRRVLPEHEGGYTIKLPLGTTPRSKEILEKMKLMQEQKSKNVFERLGNESYVTSTTQPEGDVAFRVTMGNDPCSIVRNNSYPEKKALPPLNVFHRLGGKTKTSLEPQPAESQLQYNGILKNPSAKKKIVKKLDNLVTMRADEPKVPIKLRANLKTKIGPKKSIIVTKKTVKSTINTGTEGILGKSYTQTALRKPSVKDRIGSSSGSGDKNSNKVSVVCNTSLEDGESIDLDDVESLEEEEYTPPKKVTFGETHEKIIPGAPRFLPPNVGSIVLGTGIFKRREIRE